MGERRQPGLVDRGDQDARCDADRLAGALELTLPRLGASSDLPKSTTPERKDEGRGGRLGRLCLRSSDAYGL